MLISPRSILSPARNGLAALGFALLSGCATQYPASNADDQASYVLSNDSASPIESEALNEFLSRAPAGGIVNATRSPWGDNVEIVADETYLAASGRECRQLRVVSPQNDNTQRALVCETDNGWVDQRPVTHSIEGRSQ
ncbi:MAG: DVU3141 family protein [Pseudomonadota bacterium]